MSKKWLWIFWLTCMVLTMGESSPGVLSNPTFHELLNKPYSTAHSPRIQWTYRPQKAASHWHASEGISHGFAFSPYGSTLNAMESSSEQPGYSASPQEYWRPTSADLNITNVSYYGYSRPFLEPTSGIGGAPYKDSTQGSHSIHHSQQMRLTTSSNAAAKKVPTYYIKGKLQVPNFDTLGKPKHKKTVSHQFPSDYKKTVYPKVHKPYVKHKYPIQKTVHPLYRRYYQSPYQRYSVPSTEMLRYKSKHTGNGYFKASTASPIPISEKYHTTERMDDTYPDGSAISEDYSASNSMHQNISGNYYEAYEEVEKSISEPVESSYDESSTRGYYGDRIYMSTQMLPITSDKTSTGNKYFIVRKTSHDDDIETIFE